MTIDVNINEMTKISTMASVRDEVINSIKKEKSRYAELAFLLEMSDGAQLAWVYRAIKVYDGLDETCPECTIGHARPVTKCLYFKKMMDNVIEKEKTGE